MLIECIFLETRRENTIFTGRVSESKNKNIPLPTKTPHDSRSKSHAGKTEAITQRALNETMLPMRGKGKMRRKI